MKKKEQKKKHFFVPIPLGGICSIHNSLQQTN